MRFSNLKISIKYPILIVALSLLSAAVTGVIAYTRSSEELQTAAKAKLVALRESRHVALEAYLGSIRQDLGLLASSALIRNALPDRSIDRTGAYVR